MASAEIAVTGLGAVPPDSKAEWIEQAVIVDGAEKIVESIVHEAVSAHAVGEIGALFFDRDGRPVGTKLKPTALSHQDLTSMAQNGRVVLIAGGDARKYPSIKGALLGGFVSTLVTEPETARALL